MRTLQDVRDAQSAYNDIRNTSAISSLPPSYVEGFKHLIDKDHTVTINPGITTVQGVRIELTEEWILSDNDWLERTASTLGDFYYVYLTRSGQIKVDRSPPAYSSKYFYYAHPYYGYRVIGKLFVADEIYWCSSEYRSYQNKVYIASSAYLGDADYYITGDASYLTNMAALYLSKAYGGGTVAFSAEEFDYDNDIETQIQVAYTGEGPQTVLKTDDDIDLFNVDTIENIITNMTLEYYGSTEVERYLVNSTGDRTKVYNCWIDHPGSLGVSLGGTTGLITGCDLTGGKSSIHIEAGAEAKFNAATTYENDVAKLSADKFVVVYRDGGASNHGKAIIGTISGSTITYGSAATFNSGTTTYPEVVAINDSKFIVVYRDESDSNKGKSVVCTVSGTTITTGAEQTFNNANTTHTDVALVDTDKIIVAYSDTGGSEYGIVRAGTVSGTTVTYGAEATFNSDITYEIAIQALSDSSVVVAYRDFSSTQGAANIGTVSGTSVTFGSQYVYRTGDTTYNDVATLTATKFVVCGTDGTTGPGVLYVGDVSGTVITFGDMYQYTYGNSVYTSITALGTGHVGLAHLDGGVGGGSGYGVTRVASIYGRYAELSDALVHTENATNYHDIDGNVVAYLGGSSHGYTRVMDFETPSSYSINSSGNNNTIAQNQIYGTAGKFIEAGILSGGTADIIQGNQIAGDDNKRILYGIITNDDCLRTQVMNNNISNVSKTAVVAQGTNVAVSGITAFDNGDLIDRGNCESNVAPMIQGEVTPVLSNCTWERSDEQASDYTHSYKLTVTSGGDYAHVSLTDSTGAGTTDMHGLIAGLTYRIKADFYIPAAGPDYDEVVIGWREYYSGTWNNTNISLLNTTDAWQAVSQDIIINEDATGIYIIIRIADTAATNEYIYVDNIQLIPIGINNQHEQQFIDLGTGTQT